MKECTFKEVSGKIVIDEIVGEVGSRVDYESAAKEDGIDLVLLDGKLPKWAKSAEPLFDAIDLTDASAKGLRYVYAQRTDNGVLMVGLVK